MKEHPILFTGPIVRAILAGAKWQTRRVFKAKNGGVYPNRNDLPGMRQILRNCPYGQPGDRLWVRETFARIDGQTRPWIETDYRATYTHGDRLGDTIGIKKRWTPSIHMPRHASRITLVITAVRLERLQEISPDDCIAEGAWPEKDRAFGRGHEAVAAYQQIWTEINGPDSWAANTWVWVVDFERLDVHGGIPL